MQLLEWYNLIFVAPIGLAGVYLILSATGISGETDHDLDTDADMDMDHDLDVHVDHDLDVDMDHDLDVDMDHDLDVDMDHDLDMDMDHDLDVDMDHDVDVHLEHDLDLGHDADVDLGHDLDVHHDVDVAHDADLDHDLEADHDVEVGHDADAHGVEHEVHDTHVAAHHHASFMLRALSVLGLGKVPVSILMTCLMVIFGSVGLICNGIFAHVVPWGWGPALYFWPSLGIATAGAFALTGTVARGLGRIMPTSETYAITSYDLVGRVGTAVYALNEAQPGIADVKDESGTLHRIAARPIDGEIAKGSEIIVVRYHKEGDYYDVSKSPLAEEAAEGRGSVVRDRHGQPLGRDDGISAVN